MLKFLKGGKYDSDLDGSYEDTASREAFEEIGLKKENHQIICKLCPYITMNGHYIVPILSIACHDQNEPDPYEETFNVVTKLKPNPDEVDSIIWMPLSYFSQNLNSQSVFNCIRVPFRYEKVAMTTFLNKIIPQIPEFYFYIFINVKLNVKDEHLIYGFNSFLILLVVFLIEENDDCHLNVDSVVLNKTSIIRFVETMNKCSYLLFRKILFNQQLALAKL